MKFILEEYRSLGGDKDRIVDFYRAEQPEIILAVLLDPVQAGLTDEGLQFLKDLMEDSIALEQHIAFRGWEAESAPVFEHITYQGRLYDEDGIGRRTPGI